MNNSRPDATRRLTRECISAALVYWMGQLQLRLPENAPGVEEIESWPESMPGTPRPFS